MRVSRPAGASAGDVDDDLPDGRSIRAHPGGLAPGVLHDPRAGTTGSTDEEVRNLPVSLENGRRGDAASGHHPLGRRDGGGLPRRGRGAARGLGPL